MSVEALACRVCLATEVKLYDMHQYRLVAAYETITGTRISTMDGLPNRTCSFCGTLLLKYVAFQERCIGAQGLLLETLMRHNSLTTSSIHNIDRTTNNLELPYIAKITSDEVNFAVDEKLDVRIKSDQDSEDEKPLSRINKKAHKKRKRKKSSKSIDKESVSVKLENDNFIDPIQDFNEDFEVDHSEDCDITNLNKQDNFDPTADENLIKVEENDDEVPTSKTNKKSCKRTDKKTSKESDLYEDFEVITLSKQEQIDEILARKESANYKNSFYKCDVCYKGFITETTFKNHMERHDPAGGTACSACGARWPDARSLRAHRHAAHLRRYRCRRCQHVAKSSFKAREHRKWHEGVRYICKFCGATFAKSTSHLTHVRLRHGDAQCTLCGAKVLGENGLRAHMRKAHRFQDKQTPLHCATCDTKFLTPSALSTHATNPQCELYKWCTHCGRGFESGEQLKEHLDTQHSERKECNQCPKSFSCARTLAAHTARAHGETNQPRVHAQRAVCELCGHTCTSKSTLIYHLRTHTGEKPYQCPECPKRFSVQQRLQIHIRTHTGERPFKCPFCPKAFKHKAALNRHHRVHTGAKPYQCTYCGKAFSQSNSMKSHVRTVHLKLPPPYRNRKKVEST